MQNGSRTDPRMVPVPEEQWAWLAELVEAKGLAEACRQTNLGRMAILGFISRHQGMRAQSIVLGHAFARRTAA